jgi:hypothetical protein
VIYKTEHNAVGRFPEPGDEELLAGPSRNFQLFDPLDLLNGTVRISIAKALGNTLIATPRWGRGAPLGFFPSRDSAAG